MVRKPTATNRLEAARADLAEAERRISELEAKRADALLADRDAEAARLDAELDQQRRLLRGFPDKIGLLDAAAAEEERQRRVRERLGLIERIEKKLAERDRLGAQLGDLLPVADGLYRKILELNRAIDAAWPWQGSDRLALMLPRETIFAAIEHEIFRQTAVPLRGGGLDQGNPLAGVKFPGSRPPSLLLMGNPGGVKPLVDNLRDAGEYASRIMRGVGHSPAPAEPPPAATNGANGQYLHLSNGGAAPAAAAPDNTTAPVEQRPRTAAELRLAAALQKQAELAALPSPTPDEDRQYGEVVAEVALAAAAVEAEKGKQHV